MHINSTNQQQHFLFLFHLLNDGVIIYFIALRDRFDVRGLEIYFYFILFYVCGV